MAPAAGRVVGCARSGLLGLGVIRAIWYGVGRGKVTELLRQLIRSDLIRRDHIDEPAKRSPVEWLVLAALYSPGADLHIVDDLAAQTELTAAEVKGALHRLEANGSRAFAIYEAEVSGGDQGWAPHEFSPKCYYQTLVLGGLMSKVMGSVTTK